jgi:hypothetical protein
MHVDGRHKDGYLFSPPLEILRFFRLFDHYHFAVGWCKDLFVILCYAENRNPEELQDYQVKNNANYNDDILNNGVAGEKIADTPVESEEDNKQYK